MKINKKRISITTLLGATAVASVFAAGATGITTTNSANKNFRSRAPHTQTESENKEHQLHMTQALATALGTTPEAITSQRNAGKSSRDIIKASGLDEATIKAQLEASHEADMKARLAADVLAGKLTQAQADQMITRMSDHQGHKSGAVMHGNGNEMMLAGAVTILGTTKEAIKAQITAGKSMKDIILAAGMSEADFHTKMEALRQTEMKAKLAVEVSSGKLTQAQADKMLATMVHHKGDMGHFGKSKNKGTTTITTQ